MARAVGGFCKAALLTQVQEKTQADKQGLVKKKKKEKKFFFIVFLRMILCFVSVILSLQLSSLQNSPEFSYVKNQNEWNVMVKHISLLG